MTTGQIEAARFGIRLSRIAAELADVIVDMNGNEEDVDEALTRIANISKSLISTAKNSVDELWEQIMAEQEEE